MNIDEAIKHTQGKGAGFTLKGTVEYAQSLIKTGEKVAAAVTTTIYPARGGHYPGIVVLTNRRVLAVCGLPGIKREQSFPVKDLLKVEEAESPLTYKVAFRTVDDGFRITLGPTVGKTLSKYIAKLNERYESSEGVRPAVSSRKDLKKMARQEEEAIKDAPDDLASMSEKLDSWLSEAKKKGEVSAQDPLAVAARLAHEMQKQRQ